MDMKEALVNYLVMENLKEIVKNRGDGPDVLSMSLMTQLLLVAARYLLPEDKSKALLFEYVGPQAKLAHDDLLDLMTESTQVLIDAARGAPTTGEKKQRTRQHPHMLVSVMDKSELKAMGIIKNPASDDAWASFAMGSRVDDADAGVYFTFGLQGFTYRAAVDALGNDGFKMQRMSNRQERRAQKFSRANKKR